MLPLVIEDKNWYPQIVWCGTGFDYGGYAGMNRNYIKGLESRGYRLGFEPLKGPIEVDPETKAWLDRIRAGFLDKNSNLKGSIFTRGEEFVRVVAHLPIWNVPKSKHDIIFSMMESKDVNLPFIMRCNQGYDACWTPTQYNKDNFQKMGLEIPCHVAPIGVDDIYFNKDFVIPDLKLNYKRFGDGPQYPEGFKFLSVFRWSFRKGFDALIKSYLREFKKSDNVSLIIMSRHASMSHNPKFNAAVEFEMGNLYKEHSNEDSPPIYWCLDRIDQELMPSMYSVADSFITCSRGEGFCMPALEASSMGLPVIAPYHTGFTDYITRENSYQIDVDEWVVCNNIPEWQNWITQDFVNQEFPRFGDSVVSQIQSHMREVYSDIESAKIRNEKLQKVISERYTWSKVIDNATNYLKDYV